MISPRRQELVARIKRAFTPALRLAGRAAASQPFLRRNASFVLRSYFPHLHKRIAGIALHNGLLSPGASERARSERANHISTTSFLVSGAGLLKSDAFIADARVAHLGTTGLTCGIGEYGRRLIDVYSGRGISNLLLAAKTASDDPDLSNVTLPARVVWFYDTVKGTRSQIGPAALSAMLDWRANAVIIHYHPAFFSPAELLKFALDAQDHRIAPTVIVHNFTKDAQQVFRRLSERGIVLFCHSRAQADEAATFGAAFDYIPLGVDVRPRLKSRTTSGRNWGVEPPKIVTTGFLRPHKGVRELIRAMPAIQSIFPGTALRIQCALYSSYDSRMELEACLDEIARLRLGDTVEIDTRFLDKSEIHSRIGEGDLAVLPYLSSNEGGSAAATDCLALGVPLLLSDAEIFDDLRDVALSLRPDATSIASAVLRVLGDPGLYGKHARLSADYAIANSWDAIAGAFLSACNSPSRAPV